MIKREETWGGGKGISGYCFPGLPRKEGKIGVNSHTLLVIRMMAWYGNPSGGVVWYVGKEGGKRKTLLTFFDMEGGEGKMGGPTQWPGAYYFLLNLTVVQKENKDQGRGRGKGEGGRGGNIFLCIFFDEAGQKREGEGGKRRETFSSHFGNSYRTFHIHVLRGPELRGEKGGGGVIFRPYHISFCFLGKKRESKKRVYKSKAILIRSFNIPNQPSY